MGGSYGSTQLRTADRPRVLAEAVARERSIKYLVGPAANGWVGVYPEGSGQDYAVGVLASADWGTTANPSTATGPPRPLRRGETGRGGPARQ